MPNSLLSILSIVLSLIAIVISIITIRISIKQTLFNARIDHYMVFLELYDNYLTNEKQLVADANETTDNRSLDSGAHIQSMMNSDSLYEVSHIASSIGNQALKKLNDNNELRVNFLLKVEMLKKTSKKLNFLFDQSVISEFVYAYAEYLDAAFRHYIAKLQSINEYNQRKDEYNQKKANGILPNIEPNMHEIEVEKGEPEDRERVLSKIRVLASLKERIDGENILNDIEKTIKFKLWRM